MLNQLNRILNLVKVSELLSFHPVFYLAGCKMFIVKKNGSVEVLSFLKLCPNCLGCSSVVHSSLWFHSGKFTNKGIFHL